MCSLDVLCLFNVRLYEKYSNSKYLSFFICNAVIIIVFMSKFCEIMCVICQNTSKNFAVMNNYHIYMLEIALCLMLYFYYHCFLKLKCFFTLNWFEGANNFPFLILYTSNLKTIHMCVCVFTKKQYLILNVFKW